MSHPLDGAREKLGRAEAHAVVLEREINGHAQTMRLRPELHPEPGSDYVRVTVEVLEVPEIPPRWSLLLGDLIHNLRCVLDYIAWEAVGVHDSAWRDSRPNQYVQFPIAERMRDFGSNPAVGHVSDNHRAEFKRYQPENRGKSALIWLKMLSNDDKHKLLIPVSAGPDLRESFDSIIGRRDLDWPVHELARSWADKIHTGPLESGTVIFETKMKRIGPEPEVYVKGSYTGQVALAAIGIAVVEVVEEIRNEVTEILRSFGPLFP